MNVASFLCRVPDRRVGGTSYLLMNILLEGEIKLQTNLYNQFEIRYLSFMGVGGGGALVLWSDGTDSGHDLLVSHPVIRRRDGRKEGPIDVSFLFALCTLRPIDTPPSIDSSAARVQMKEEELLVQ